jgi:hypothetical protein
MDELIIEKLYGKFNLSSRAGTGGMTFKYVPNEDVINRMNEVFKGDWSTKVMFRDVMDDQVILEVVVSVVDPETKISHTHTGFGSQQIMRYNSGTNAGKVIDIGNGYKGALAKAIVNACTRWGVGLYKEDDPVSVEMPTMPPMAGVAAPTAPAPVVPNTPSVVVPPPMTATPPPTPYVQELTAVPNVPAPPTVVVPTVAPPTPMPIPAVVETPVVAETTTVFPPPMMPGQPVAASLEIKQEEPTIIPVAPTPVIPPTPVPEMPKIPSPNMGVSQAPVAPAPGLETVGISDVQKVALNGILSMNNADYGELANEAFQANSITKVIPPRESLSYEEAVVVIKFGNEKYRKNR